MEFSKEECERLFPNIFDRLEYVLELKHYSLDSGCDAWIYTQELIKEAIKEGRRLQKST